MKTPTPSQPIAAFDMSPPVGLVLVELSAEGSSGVLRTMRARGPALIHFQNGNVTRVQADDFEPLVAFLVRKELLTVAEMRAALNEVEHLDVTLAESFARLGLMDKNSLDRLRARRTRDAIEDIVSSGGRAIEFEDRPSDPGPPVEVVKPVIRALLSSGAAEEWLDDHGFFQGSIKETEAFGRLQGQIINAVGEDTLPAKNETTEQISQRLGKRDFRKVAAMMMVGLLELEEHADETPEFLEQRAAAMEATEEACRLLIRASALYETQGYPAEARRAGLSALRRRPTASAPLAQVERLCAQAGEIATLELVYELVNSAMPGPHGRRAVLYRAGRVFEVEFNDIPRAREYYQRAIIQVSESGAALDALKRTSEALGDIRTIAQAYATIGLSSHRPDQRESWLQRAADLARQAGDDKSAEEILAQIVHDKSPNKTQPPPDIDIKAPQFIPPAEASSAPPPPMTPTPSMAFSEAFEGSDLFDWSSLDDAFANPEDANKQADAQGETQEPPGDSEDTDEQEVPEEFEESEEDEELDEAEAPEEYEEEEEYEEAEEYEEEDPLEQTDQDLEQPDQEELGEIMLTPEQAKPTKRPAPISSSIEEAIKRTSEFPPSYGSSPLEEKTAAFAMFPNDPNRLDEMVKATEGADEGPVLDAVRSFLALFDSGIPSRPLGQVNDLKPITHGLINELVTLPQSPEILALEVLWKAASQLVTKDLADLGVGRAIPMRSDEVSPASKAFSIAHPLLPIEPMRLLHMASGPTARVVLSRPLSLLTGPSGMIDTPDLFFRVSTCVAMGLSRLVLPCLLSAHDLGILLQSIHAAFGQSPPRGSLHFIAASLAQDLWTAVPSGSQDQLKQLLQDSPMPDIEALKVDSLAAAHRVALLITGDAASAIRTAVADNPFLSGTDPTKEEGFFRAVVHSEHLADLVRLALWPRYWEFRKLGA